jgi:hypothetical protein
MHCFNVLSELIVENQLWSSTRMKRSEEIRSLANRWRARAFSVAFTGEPEMRGDMISTVKILEAEADRLASTEETGNGRGPDHPETLASIGG